MSSGKLVLGVLGGVAVGALLGVLFAPHKGSKTRRKILDTGKDYVEELKDKFDGVYQEANNKYENFISEAREIIAKEEK